MDEELMQEEYGFALNDDLFLINEYVSNREEIIERLGELLLDKGYVRETFINAIIEREKIYPTGLKTTVTGVALPHTDTEHVIRSTIAIATLAKPISFHAMGYPDQIIDNVELVIMLAIQDKNNVVEVLRKIISILEEEETLKLILMTNEKSVVKDLIIHHLRSSS